MLLVSIAHSNIRRQPERFHFAGTSVPEERAHFHTISLSISQYFPNILLKIPSGNLTRRTRHSHGLGTDRQLPQKFPGIDFASLFAPAITSLSIGPLSLLTRRRYAPPVSI